MNVTLWDTSSDVRKKLSIQDDRTESDNRIEVTLLIGIAENNLPHIARWESTKPPYAEPHVRWCGRSVNVKIGGKCLLWLAFTSYPIDYDRNSAKISSHIPINDRWITNAILGLSPLNSNKTFTSYWEKSCSYTIKLFFLAYESSVQSLGMSVQSLWMCVQSLWMSVQSLWTENILWFNEIFAVV